MMSGSNHMATKIVTEELESSASETTPRKDSAGLPAPAIATSQSVSWAGHLRRFFRFVGPTWLIASTFVDPGAITAALQQGSETRYTLIWISWWSLVFGYIFQVRCVPPVSNYLPIVLTVEVLFHTGATFAILKESLSPAHACPDVAAATKSLPVRIDLCSNLLLGRCAAHLQHSVALLFSSAL